MENTRLDALRKSIETLSIEAKDAFIRKFPYLKITDTECKNVFANKIQFNVPETDGSLFIGLGCNLTRSFSVFEMLLSDNNVAPFNLKINHVFNKEVTFYLSKFFYHTKKKFIFSM